MSTYIYDYKREALYKTGLAGKQQRWEYTLEKIKE